MVLHNLCHEGGLIVACQYGGLTGIMPLARGLADKMLLATYRRRATSVVLQTACHQRIALQTTSARDLKIT